MVFKVIKHNINKNVFPILNTSNKIDKDMQCSLILKIVSILYKKQLTNFLAKRICFKL